MAADQTRRAFLAGASAVVLAARLPVAQALPSAPSTVRPPLPSWIVGTPGEADHEVIRAATREAAILFRSEVCDFEDDPNADPAEGEGGPECECEACFSRNGYEATRVEAWDGRPVKSIGDADWLTAGFDATCSRCSYEANRCDGSHVVLSKVVCSDCMTLADWEIVDPERAAELREETSDA